MVCIPRQSSADKPALIIELKWDESAETAIEQILEKNYPKSLQEYGGNLLLVGISYSRKTKKHRCKIRRWTKEL